MTSKELSALTVGAVLGDGDAESIAWSRAIGSVSRAVTDLGFGVVSPVGIGVVYHVDGRMAPNDFQGVRTGHYNRRNSRLAVQVAVPKIDMDDKRTYLLELLEDAVIEGERYVQKRALAPGLPELRGLVERLLAQS